MTADLHELVSAMDAYSGRVLRERFGVEWNLLAFLMPLASGPLGVTRLAERLNLTRAAVSKRVPLLERDGWLTRSVEPHRRGVRLSLTPAGHELVTTAGDLLNQRFAVLLAEASVDVETFGTQVRTLIDAVVALDAKERS